MAQIFVFGRVMNDLVPKESQSKQSYVCFDLMERTKNWTQFYQVWAWDADVTRLMQFKVKKRQYDLACRLTAAGRCSHEGRQIGKETEGQSK